MYIAFAFFEFILEKVTDAWPKYCSSMSGISSSFTHLLGKRYFSEIEMFLYRLQAKMCLHGKPNFVKVRQVHSLHFLDTVFAEF